MDRREADCDVCGRRFSYISSRCNKAKYCSRSCYYKAMTRMGSVEVTCEACGDKFLRPPSKTKAARLCCSVRCRGILSRKPRPSGANSTRKWMKIRSQMQQCGRCGYDEHPEILVVHHRDRNHKNNELTNLEVLCPNCHALEHYGKT